MSSYATLATLLFIYMTSWFVFSLLKKRNDVADIAWGLGFVLLAWVSLLLTQNVSLRGLLVTALVTLWGLRLSWHIHQRNNGKSEDYRYKTWREEWGQWFFVRSYFQVYLLQGFFLFLIVLPVTTINFFSTTSLTWLDAVGIIVWLFGMTFEVIGDRQLAQFLKNPDNKGNLMRSGLWAYTRHPNYFGEVTVWWGLWIIALSVPYGIYTIIGPLTITFLILFVSGIPMLEKKMKQHPDFANYERSTSKFIPWFSKSTKF